MPFPCFSCGKDLGKQPDGRVGRAAECPHCRIDMHVCFNCLYYDPKSYNECREPQAERVVDKDRRNYCDYFSLREGPLGKLVSDAKEKIKGLDDLFKK